MSAVDELSRRRRLIFRGLSPHLSETTMRSAIVLCDKEFAEDGVFSLTKFLRRLGQIDASVRDPLHFFEILQPLQAMTPEQLGPDPGASSNRDAYVANRKGSWFDTATALVSELVNALRPTQPKLALAIQNQTAPITPTASKEQLHNAIHSLYLLLCEELGPVTADKWFAKVVRLVDSRPDTTFFPVKSLL